jgi:hypothetical protein
VQITPFGASSVTRHSTRISAHSGGYLRAAAEALVGGQGSADGEDALTSCLPVR